MSPMQALSCLSQCGHGKNSNLGLESCLSGLSVLYTLFGHQGYVCIDKLLTRQHSSSLAVLEPAVLSWMGQYQRPYIRETMHSALNL